jgi:hypothetical protein
MKNWEPGNDGKKRVLYIHTNEICDVTPEEDAFFTKYSSRKEKWRYFQFCGEW